MSDRVFAVIWFALCLAGLWLAWQIHSTYNYEPLGPRPFPLAIMGLMLLCSAGLMRRLPDAVIWPQRPILLRLLAMVAALLVYAWGFEWLGFPLATALLTAVMGVLFGARWRAAGASGLVLGVLLWYVFDVWLEVSLPLGVWLS